MGVVAAGSRQIAHRSVEVVAAGRAVMLGVDQVQLAGTATARIAQIVQAPRRTTQAIGAVAAVRAAAARVVAAAVQDERRRQFLDLRDPLRGIRHIFPYAGHGPLLGSASPKDYWSLTPVRATGGSGSLLQSPKCPTFFAQPPARPKTSVPSALGLGHSLDFGELPSV